MQKYNIKAIGEVIVMTVSLFALVMLGVYGYGLIQFLMFLVPLPAVIIYLKYGIKYSVIGILIGTLLSFIFIDPRVAGLIVIMFLIPTIAFMITRKKEMNFISTFIIMTIAYVAATIFEYTVILKIVSNTNFISIIDTIVNSSKASIDNVRKMYLDAGMNKDQVDNTLNVLRESFTKRNILIVVPGILSIISIISSYLTCFVSERMFKRLKIKTNYEVKVYNIYINNLFLAFSIILGCIGLLLSNRNIILGDYIYETVVMVVGFWLIVTAFSLIVHYLKYKQKFKNWLIVLIVIFALFLVQLLNYLYVAAAFIDSFVDFRKIGFKKSNKKQGEE
ncbi:DUF2232 domain-containing protein [Clostridium felsineum]|uniref:Uncharacterized protein n=1 Tax=Clostridium felsineum TaxID=36839 RepID=A0A1S8LY56_9CLOT|nr:DUF2232 domain-containing protein [Clostridium felsineum]MCR3761140.1 DUF2232 domain-containing protein [Clostridium felsineum]URZ02796.1 hypothetical protein CLAUR_028290 [Clostridium felsineum]URZ08878.1 hypothetical protein CLROS_042730 [Clostridium felsineum]URZ09506.1 hypothetical protein CROST_001780 [Clostridium felsineum]URZ14140.1 hypothetical protein CLFE_001240 [Clostridium felsineum DSM 794]